MDITLPWRDGDSKTVLWRLVRAAGAGGAAVRDLIERSGLSRNTVRNQLANLECDGYVRHPGGGHEHHHRWVPGAKRPPIEGLVLELALEALNDCPAGMQERVLCDVLACSLKDLDQALVPAEREGRVERMSMPAQHGGGMGWRLPAPLVDMLRGDHDLMALHELPVVEVDIDRIHRVHRTERFELERDGDCLALSLGGLTLTLTPANVAILVAFLRHQGFLEGSAS